MNFRIIKTVMVVFVLLQSHSFSQEVAKPKIVVKFGTLAPEGSIWMVRNREVMEEVNQKTGNKFKVIFYSGGVLGDEVDMVRLMKLGQLHMGGFTARAIHSILPEMSVLELPFLFEDLSEVDYIRKKMFPTFSKMFEKKGFVLILWVDQGGFLNLFSQAPVRSPEELKKQKVWTWSGDEVALETLEAFGVKPIPVQIPDVLASLQMGLINAFFATPLASVALQWFAHVKYATVLNLRYEPGVITATKELMNSVPTELRKSAIKIIRDSGEKTIDAIRRSDNLALMNMAQQGIKIISLTEEEKEEFRQKARSVYYKLADKLYPRELLDEVLKNLDEYRKMRKEKR